MDNESISLLVFCTYEMVTHLVGLESRKEGIELPLFDLTAIATATSNFSDANLIEEGGFRPVYITEMSDSRVHLMFTSPKSLLVFCTYEMVTFLFSRPSYVF